MLYTFTLTDTHGKQINARVTEFETAFDANSFGFRLRSAMASLGITVKWERVLP